MAEIIERENFDEVNLIDKDGNLFSSHILIVGTVGQGKTALSERILQDLWKKGYIVIILTHKPHKMFESCFCLFDPFRKYHLDILKKQGSTPQKMSMKIYAPFTFNLKEYNKLNNLPNIKFFTIPLTSLGEDEISLIFENNSKSDEVKLAKRVIDGMKGNEGLFDFMYKCHKELERIPSDILKRIKVPRVGKRDDFFLDIPTSGSKNTISSIMSYMHPFQKDYFIANEDPEMNLDFKEILSNQKDWHYLCTGFFSYSKNKYVSVIWFLNNILKNIQYSKHPIVFYIPEGKIFLPQNSDERYIIKSTEILMKMLSGIRNIGKGCSSITDTQNLYGVMEDYRECMSVEFYSKLSNDDIESLSKTQGLKSDTKRALTSMRKGQFIVKGDEDNRIFTCLMPSFAHADEGVDFDKLYEKYYPDQITNYSPLIKEMDKKFIEEQKNARERIDVDVKQERENINREVISRAKEDKSREKLTEAKQTIRDQKLTEKDLMMKTVYNEAELMLSNSGKINWSELSGNHRISDKTAKKMWETYKRILEDQKNPNNIQ